MAAAAAAARGFASHRNDINALEEGWLGLL